MKILADIKKIHKIKMLSLGAHSLLMKVLFWCGVLCLIMTGVLLILLTKNIIPHMNRTLCVVSLIFYIFIFIFWGLYNLAWQYEKKISSFVELNFVKKQ
jgi:hypothetical protein